MPLHGGGIIPSNMMSLIGPCWLVCNSLLLKGLDICSVCVELLSAVDDVGRAFRLSSFITGFYLGLYCVHESFCSEPCTLPDAK